MHIHNRHSRTIRHYEQAIASFRDIGFVVAIADALDGLARFCVASGDHDRARAVWQDALALYRQEGSDRTGVVHRQLDGLGDPTISTASTGLDYPDGLDDLDAE